MERNNAPPKKKKKKDPQLATPAQSTKRTGIGKEADVPVNSKTYACISPETISRIAESVGISSISDDIAVNLAEDVSYKLQEVISSSCTIMRCCNRRKLRTSDLSAAFQLTDAPPILGHSVESPFNFIPIPDADVFVGDDNEVDLSLVALNPTPLMQPKQSYVATSWPLLDNLLKSNRGKHSGKSSDKPHLSAHSQIIAVNGEVKSENLESHSTFYNDGLFPLSGNLHSSVSEVVNGALKPEPSELFSLSNIETSCGDSIYDIYSHKSSSVKENGSVNLPVSKGNVDFKFILPQNSEEEVHLSSTQLLYFHAVANCILQGSDCHFQQAITDLRTNEKLGTVVAPLLNLVALTVYHVPRHFGLLMRLLETVDALLFNQFANPSFSISVNRVVNALLAISSDQNLILGDDFLLRRKAAQLLARVLAEWNVEEQHMSELLSRVALVLGDSREPIQSQYGALVIFQSLGKPVLADWLLPLLRKYIPFLEHRPKLVSQSASLQMEEIRGVLLNIVYLLHCKSGPTCSPTMTAALDLTKAMSQLDMLLYQYIGDAVCARRSSSSDSFQHIKKKRMHRNNGNNSCTKADLRQKTPTSALFGIHFFSNSSGVSERRCIQPGIFQEVNCSPASSRKEIHFRFAGANPVPKERLKRRVLDKTHTQFVEHIHGPLHALYQRQYPMVGNTPQSRTQASFRHNITSYCLLTTI